MERRLSEAVRIDGERIREIPDIVLHEHRGLVTGVTHGFGDIVPTELGDTGVAEAPKDRLLALIQRVQAHEHIPDRLWKHIRQGIRHGCAFLEPLSEVPIHHAFISHTFLMKLLPEVRIERIQDVPDLEKTGFYRTVVRVQADGEPASVIAEMRDEMPDSFALGVGQVTVVILDALEVRHVGEKVFRIHEELVHVIEVREDDLAPEDEFVQGFSLGINRLVRFIQFQQQADAVRHFPAIYPAEKVIDGQ